MKTKIEGHYVCHFMDLFMLMLIKENDLFQKGERWTEPGQKAAYVSPEQEKSSLRSSGSKKGKLPLAGCWG